MEFALTIRVDGANDAGSGRHEEQSVRSLVRSGLRALWWPVLMLISLPALALPRLQLGIGDGYYDQPTQTIMTGADTFTLYAYGRASGSKAVTTSDSHFIAVAVTPQIGPAPVEFGSFSINGQTYGIADMVYGNPPLEDYLAFDPGDLSPHGIYDTFFLEIEFFFSNDFKTASVNTQDSPSHVPVAGSGTALFAKAFDVDISGLLPGFNLHFDLYDDKIKSGGDIDIEYFAPFSHDAGTARILTPVPEPRALVLLAMALLAIGVLNPQGTLRGSRDKTNRS